MFEMVKEDPGPSRGYSHDSKKDYDQIALALRRDPGQVYKIHTSVASCSTGRGPMESRGCQVAHRRNKKSGGWDIYAWFPEG